MKNTFNALDLIRVKIFALRDVWLFIIGIMLVSATSGAIGAFMLGVTTEEFLIGEADDILIVAQPGTTTPITGAVPEYLQHDIENIRGVRAISAETLGFAVAQNFDEKSVLVRGVTPVFTQLAEITLLEGSWFDSSYGTADIDRPKGAVIGYILSSSLGIGLGDTIKLASTITDMVLDVFVTGVIKTDTPSDEEILVSLSLGKSLTNKDIGYVSFFRVLIDEAEITKDKLFTILNTEYTVPVVLKSLDPRLNTPATQVPIVVYTAQGAFVKEQMANIGSIIDFTLGFGTYEFIATPPDLPNSPVLTVLVNQTFSAPVSLTIGEPRYTLFFNVTYNKEAAINASLTLWETFGDRFLHISPTNSSGFARFDNLTATFHTLYVEHGEIFQSYDIVVNESTTVELELESSLELIVTDINTGAEVNGGHLQILFTSNQTLIYDNENYQNGTLIFLEPAEYEIRFELGGVIKRQFASIYSHVRRYIQIGRRNLRVWVRGENGLGLVSSNVTIMSEGQRVAQDFTNSNGIVDFQVEVGVEYQVIAISPANQSQLQNNSITFQNDFTLAIDLVNIYRLDLIVVNGTLASQPNNTLVGATIRIFNASNHLIGTDISDSSGQVSFSLTIPGQYNIQVEKDIYNINRTTQIRLRNHIYQIPLGKVKLNITTLTPDGVPLEGISVILIDQNGYSSESRTNKKGRSEVIVPIGTYIMKFIKGPNILQENITLSESQILTVVKTMKLSGRMTLELLNKFSQKMNKGFIQITNSYYNLTFEGFTDVNGEVTFYKMPWGNWTVKATFFEESFPRQLISFTAFEDKIPIQVTAGIVIDLSGFNFRQGQSYSIVLSGDFVSGFLQSTLNIIITTFSSLVIIVSVLSLLSIASVISHPIVSNSKTLRVFRQLGTSRAQVLMGVVTQLSLLGFFASAVGAFIGMWLMTLFPELRNVNVGGMIIRPQIDLGIILTILGSNVAVIVAKASQKTNELVQDISS
ncbi:MAG: ABC transporter permease [Candidatus Thorarchaeota archaeon]